MTEAEQEQLALEALKTEGWNCLDVAPSWKRAERIEHGYRGRPGRRSVAEESWSRLLRRIRWESSGRKPHKAAPA
jgi:hypothetical protein